MRRTIVAASAAALALCWAATASAFPFPVSDVRGLGMGGAYVAEGSGVGAVNYNPAGLARGRTFELSVPVVARVQDHIDMYALLDDVDALLDGQDVGTWAATAYATQPEELDQMIRLLTDLDRPGRNSVDLTANGMAGACFHAFGLALGVGYAGEVVGSLVADVDSAHLGTDPLQASSWIGSNASEVELYGIEARQLVLSGAKAFGGLAVGANLRQISGQSYFTALGLFDNTDVEVYDLLDQTAEDISSTAVDAGVQFDLPLGLRAGLVGRNLNGPSFDLPAGGGELELDPRYRAGLAWDLPLLKLAADVDLTTTESFSGAEFREMALGAELDLPVVKIRAGMSRNTALDGSPTTLHAGIGLSLWVLKIDIGAAKDSDERTLLAGASVSAMF